MTDSEIAIKKIAGRGRGPQMNWGADVSRPISILRRQLRELEKHIGEFVVVSGGGGNGYMYAILKGAELAPFGKAMGLKAHLDRITPNGGWGRKFDPWIDSWQINIVVDREFELKLRKRLLRWPIKKL